MASSDRGQAELIRALYRNIHAGGLVMLFAGIIACGGVLYMAPDRLPRVQGLIGPSAAPRRGCRPAAARRRAPRARGQHALSPQCMIVDDISLLAARTLPSPEQSSAESIGPRPGRPMHAQAGECALLPKRQNCSAKSGDAAKPANAHLGWRGKEPAMNIALALMSFGFAVVMAIPIAGPLLLALH